MEAVEDLGEMGPLFTRVSFRVRCAETRFGEFVAVCGELPELGAWDPAQALRLYTSPATFPVWQSDTVLIGTYVSSAQYKFVIIPKDDGVVGAPVRWEALLSNRVFTPVGEELSIAHDYGAQGGAGPGHSGPASPELSALDVSAGPTGPEGQLDLPPSLAEVASRARAPQHANPLDGSERVLLVTLRLPVKLERDEDTGQWVGTWDESTMWATSVDGGRA
ncbi:carbohydrate-binding-like protein, partial [Pavlovales sp. CCMP2436]